MSAGSYTGSSSRLVPYWRPAGVQFHARTHLFEEDVPEQFRGPVVLREVDVQTECGRQPVVRPATPRGREGAGVDPGEREEVVVVPVDRLEHPEL